jgi:hypothetical protein
VSQKSINPTEVTEFKAAVKAAQVAAKKLMLYKKEDLEDSSDKFLFIRAIRIDHTARETASGKSLRS